MAHFAQLDENNIVLNVIVVADSDTTNPETGEEDENIGIAFLKRLFGENSRWKQTSYNTRKGVYYDPETGLPGKKPPFRKNYAGIGHRYDEEMNAFIPKPRYKNTILDTETCEWVQPIPCPVLTEEQKKLKCWYEWNDDEIRWDLVTPKKS